MKYKQLYTKQFWGQFEAIQKFQLFIKTNKVYSNISLVETMLYITKNINVLYKDNTHLDS